MNPRVIHVLYMVPHSLVVTFTNKEKKEFDLKPYLNYPIYQKLKEESYCKKVRVKDGVIVWDDETDFDPDTIYLEGKSIV